MISETYFVFKNIDIKRALYHFDLSEVMMVKKWPRGSQNGKLMPYSNSLTQWTYIKKLMMKKFWNLTSQRSGWLKVTSERSKWKANAIFEFHGSIKIYLNILKFWPLRGQGGQNETSRRSKSKTDVIFRFLDPKNICIDTHDVKNYILKFWPLRGKGGQKVTSERSRSKTDVIFEFLDPKNIYI